MHLAGIGLYTGRALVFALICCAIGAIFLLLVKKQEIQNPSVRWKLALVTYLAALIQITVIRDFSNFFAFLSTPYEVQTIQPIPLSTTAAAFRQGAWPFIYHVVGNMVWFLPLGILLPMVQPKLRRWSAVALVSAAVTLSIEVLQFLFHSGVSDLDDCILNVAGAMVGFWGYRLTQKRRECVS